MSDTRNGSRDAPRSSSSSRPDKFLGQMVGGRYTVVSLIARGGMGKVYLAQRLPSGGPCALKILSPRYEGSRNPEFHKRFQLEAATISKLSHENTVSIFEHGNDGDTYFIAMEYVEGRTLAKALREDGPFPEARAIRVAQQIGRSVAEAHGYGLVHRDLKPANIIVTDRENAPDFVKVLDFGLVKDISGNGESLTQSGIFMGSPKYMAPEQVLDTGVSIQTDMYSLGIILFEMLAGRVPFDCGAGAATLMAHVNEPIPSLAAKNPDVTVSPALQAVVKRCLQKEPSSRFGTMAALLFALEQAASGEAVDPLDISAAAPTPRQRTEWIEAEDVTGEEEVMVDVKLSAGTDLASGQATARAIPGRPAANDESLEAQPVKLPSVAGSRTWRLLALLVAAIAAVCVVVGALYLRSFSLAGW